MRAWIDAHRSRWDAIVAGVITTILLVVTIGAKFAEHDHPEAPLAVGIVLALCQGIPLAWRRRMPMRALLATGAAAILSLALGFASPGGLPVLIAVFSAALYRPRGEQPWRPLTLVAAGTVLATALSGSPPWDAIPRLILFGLAWVVGDNLRTRRAYLRSLEERAIRAERERESNAARAVIEERARIARELHDVVAHSMSVMVVQAGAGRRILERSHGDAVVLDALRSIEETGRDALSEMRRLLGVLRQEGDESLHHPQPTVDQIESLVDGLRDTGMDVALSYSGTRHPLPPGVDLSAFRIVQEALTNTLKHAGPAKVDVRLTWTDDALEVEVEDDGRGAATATAVPGGGHGLVGMRERVAVFGGDLTVGPRRGGGYRVSARLPFVPDAHTPTPSR